MTESIQNPFISIWTKPRATMGYLANTTPEKYIHTLAALGGSARAFGRLTQEPLEQGADLGITLLTTLVTGGISGLFALYIISFAIYYIGKSVLGGNAHQDEIRTVVAWSKLFLIASLIFTVPLIAHMGESYFYEVIPFSGLSIIGYICFALSILAIPMQIWGIVAYCRGIGEVQGFSAWKGLLNLVLAFLLVLIPLMIIVFIFLLPMMQL